MKITSINFKCMASLAMMLALSACSTTAQPTQTKSSVRDGAPVKPVNLSEVHEVVPKYEPKSAYGNPTSYVAVGKRYYVMGSAAGYSQKGVASWYGTKFHGKLTSSHEPYDMLAMTAASPVLPIPTYVRVTNLDNGKQAIVRVNDRGPFANGRIMDLSYAAAKKLGYAEKGTAHVEVAAITFDNTQAVSTIYLQVGAFNKMAEAEQVQRSVSQWTHHNARIQTVLLNEKTWYRVQVGPLQNIEKPDVVNVLHKKGIANTLAIMS